MAKKSGHKRLSSRGQTLVVDLKDHGQDLLQFHIKDSVIVGDYLKFTDDLTSPLRYQVTNVELVKEVSA